MRTGRAGNNKARAFLSHAPEWGFPLFDSDNIPLAIWGHLAGKYSLKAGADSTGAAFGELRHTNRQADLHCL